MKTVLLLLFAGAMAGCAYDPLAYGPPQEGTYVIAEPMRVNGRHRTVTEKTRRSTAVAQSNTKAVQTAAAPTSEARPPVTTLPTAIRAEGKPANLVTLPGSSGVLIDVSGLPSGTVARDPSTGQQFIVP